MPRFFDQISESTMRFVDGLNDRERRLVGILLACLGLLLVFSILFFATSKISSKRAQLTRNNAQLHEIRSLEKDFIQARNKNERARLAIMHNDISLMTFIHSVSNRFGLAVKDLSETKRPLAKSNVVEISVKLNLTKLSIDKVTALLEALETSDHGELIKVTKLKINKRFDEPDLLDLQMTVSTWKSA